MLIPFKSEYTRGIENYGVKDFYGDKNFNTVHDSYDFYGVIDASGYQPSEPPCNLQCKHSTLGAIISLSNGKIGSRQEAVQCMD